MLSDDSEQLLLTLIDLALRNMMVTLYNIQIKNINYFQEIEEEFKEFIIDQQFYTDKQRKKRMDKLYELIGNEFEMKLRTNRNALNILNPDDLNNLIGE